MKEYYDKRAPEYDDWYLGRGLFEPRDRAGWDAELEQFFAVIGGLEPGRTLDVACGTGFLTRHLRGDVVGLDQSKRTGHFYGHLEPPERERFLAEARRVASELVVVVRA